jgi:hypothetical protein
MGARLTAIARHLSKSGWLDPPPTVASAMQWLIWVAENVDHCLNIRAQSLMPWLEAADAHASAPEVAVVAGRETKKISNGALRSPHAKNNELENFV